MCFLRCYTEYPLSLLILFGILIRVTSYIETYRVKTLQLLTKLREFPQVNSHIITFVSGSQNVQRKRTKIRNVIENYNFT
jgi:hypothetical protein